LKRGYHNLPFRSPSLRRFHSLGARQRKHTTKTFIRNRLVQRILGQKPKIIRTLPRSPSRLPRTHPIPLSHLITDEKQTNRDQRHYTKQQPEQSCKVKHTGSLHSRLRLPWRLATRTLRRRRRHKTATILTWNHDHFLNNHFPRRLNPSLLQRLMNLQKINHNKNHRQPKNKEQRNKNNPNRVHNSIIPQQPDYSIYELQLQISMRVGAPQTLSPLKHAKS